MKRKLLAAALAAGFGMAAVAQPPGAAKPGTASSTTTSGTAGTTGSTITTADTNLVRAELDDLTAFIDTLVEDFGIDFETEQEARLFVLTATHFYLSAKLQAGHNGHSGRGTAAGPAGTGK